MPGILTREINMGKGASGDGLAEGARAGRHQHGGDGQQRDHVRPEVHEPGAADDDPARDRDVVGGGEEAREDAQGRGSRAPDASAEVKSAAIKDLDRAISRYAKFAGVQIGEPTLSMG